MHYCLRPEFHCVVCGDATPLDDTDSRHACTQFCVRRSDGRRESAFRPVYYQSHGPDYRALDRTYCSAACSLADHQQQRHAA